MLHVPHPRFSRWVSTRRLSINDLRLLLYFLSRLDFDDFRKVTLQVASYDLHIAPQHLSAAFKRLQDQGIIEVGEPVGRTKTVRLNRSLILDGKIPGGESVIVDTDELVRTGAWPADENRAVAQEGPYGGLAEDA